MSNLVIAYSESSSEYLEDIDFKVLHCDFFSRVKSSRYCATHRERQKVCKSECD